MPQPHKQSEEDRNGIFFATIFGAMAGTPVGFGLTFIWWLALIGVIVGFGLHVYVRNQRVHAGSILLAFVGTAVICIVASSFGMLLCSWLYN